MSSTKIHAEAVPEFVAGFLLSHAELIQLAKKINKSDPRPGPSDGVTASLASPSIKHCVLKENIPVKVWNITQTPDPQITSPKTWLFQPNDHQVIKFDNSHAEIKQILEWFVKYGFIKEKIQSDWQAISNNKIDDIVSVVI